MSASSLSGRFAPEGIAGAPGVIGALPIDGNCGSGTARWGAGTGTGGGAGGATTGAGGAAAPERPTGDGRSAGGTTFDGGAATAARGGSTTGRVDSAIPGR